MPAGILGVRRTEDSSDVCCVWIRRGKKGKELLAVALTVSLNLCNTFSEAGSVFVPGAIFNLHNLIWRPLCSKASESVQVCGME